MTKNSGSFEISLDVQNCRREEVQIELKEDCIVINTRKVKTDDNSIVARKFSKRIYPLEIGKYDKESLTTHFENGMLRIKISQKEDPKAKVV